MKVRVSMTRGPLFEVREYDNLEQCLLSLSKEFDQPDFVVTVAARSYCKNDLERLGCDWEVEIYNDYRE